MIQIKKKFKGKMELFLILLLILGTVVGIANIIDKKYGSFSLHPGEKYTVNIPFLGAPKSSFICGKAEYWNGSAVEGVNVTVKYHNNETVLATNKTDKNGFYCVYLPEIKKVTKYDIYVDYENRTDLVLGSNDYTLNLDTEKDSYSLGEIVKITGTIENEDAEIDGGRMLVSLAYCNGTFNESSKACKGTPGKWIYLYDDKSYSLNINKNYNQYVPYDDFDVRFNTSDADKGWYRFSLKASFNSKEHTKTIYFNVT